MALKDKYFTISKAAKEIGVTRQTISRWIADGKISAEKVGRETLIKKKDLHKYHRWRVSKTATESIMALFKVVSEEYLVEKGYIEPGEHVEIVPADKADIPLPPEQKDEILSRFRPILEKYLKDFSQRVSKKNPPKSKKEGKTTKPNR